jgi:hypothetical protein
MSQPLQGEVPASKLKQPAQLVIHYYCKMKILQNVEVDNDSESDHNLEEQDTEPE